MTKQDLSRRSLLQRSLALPLGGIVLAATGASVANAAATVCADPKTMDSGAKSIRDSLHYLEAAPEKDKTCGGCGFFVATAGGCGTCMIFQGPANAMGHCDSWSAKG